MDDSAALCGLIDMVRELVDVLHEKGILSREEVLRLAQATLNDPDVAAAYAKHNGD